MPYINIPFFRFNGDSPDDHTLNHTVRIAFQQAAVHIRSRIAFVSIANNVSISLMPAASIPFDAGGESATAASP